MVQTYQSPVRVYQYPFEFVMVAYEKRFPRCEQIPILVNTEITSEELSADGAEHVVDRKCTIDVEAPYLLKKVAGVDYVYFTQRNSLDKRRRTLKIEATNISFSTRLEVKEFCIYYVHPENDEWTCFEQSAQLDVKSFFGFEATVEKLAVKQYGASLQKGKEILQHFINDMLENGVRPGSVPRWAEPSTSTLTRITAVAADARNSDDGLQVLDQASSCADSAIEIDANRRDSVSGGTLTSQTAEAEPSSPPDQSAEADNILAASQETPKIADAKGAPNRQVSVRLSIGSVDREPVFSQEKQASDKGQTSQSARREEVHRRPRLGSGVAIKRQPTMDADTQDVRLDEQYIQQFLGPLAPLEESRLCELKYNLQNSGGHKKLPNDAHLLRFLRARDFDVHKAREMITKSIMWRKHHNVDKILKHYTIPPVVAQFFPGAWHAADIDGRPLYILRLGCVDVKGLVKSCGVDGTMKLALHIMEEGLEKTYNATLEQGRPISTWSLLVDVDGLSMRHLWRPAIAALKQFIEIAENNYPETLGRVIVVRAPRVFPVLWTLVAPFIDENTRKKFYVHAGESPPTAMLAQFIPKENIPEFLGGESYVSISEGGHIPKSLYLSISAQSASVGTTSPPNQTVTSAPLQTQISHHDAHTNLKPWDQELANLYTIAHAYKHAPCEVLVPVNRKGCVLTWDFDVIKGRCAFAIYCLPDRLLPAAVAQGDKPFGGLDLGMKPTTSGCITEENVCAFDRTLRLGADLTLAEPPVICNDDDSMQVRVRRVSVMFKCPMPQPFPVRRSDRRGHRGSMASLESCRSSFSSLNMAMANMNSGNVKKM